MSKIDKTITIGLVREDDSDLTFLDVKDSSRTYDELVELVSPESHEATLISLNELDIGENVFIFTDAFASTSSAGYNMSIHIFPLFGTIIFAQFAINNDGKIFVSSLSKDNQKVINEYVSLSKKFEIENGGRQAIIDRVNEIGKNAYLEELNERYKDLYNNEVESKINEKER